MNITHNITDINIKHVLGEQIYNRHIPYRISIFNNIRCQIYAEEKFCHFTLKHTTKCDYF